MLKKQNYQTKFGFALPEVTGRVERLQMYPNGISEGCFCVYASLDSAPLETIEFMIPPQTVLHGDIFTAAESWLTTATKPAEVDGVLQEVLIIGEGWTVASN